jgi:hypothetical protein
MAIDFPASPTNGQTFTSGGMTYVYNGTGWTVKGGTTLDWVLKAGDTMTGALVLPSDPAAALQAATKQYVDSVRTYVDTQNAAQNTANDAAMKAYAAPLDALAYNGMQVNGGMEVSQQWGAVAVIDNGYPVDGWSLSSAGVNIHSAQVTGLLSQFPSNAIVLVLPLAAKPSLAATDYAQLRQGIEGYRTAKLRWGTPNAQPITIGFWSDHFRTGTYSGSIKNATNNRCYVFTYTQNVSEVAEYKTVTIPGCTDGVWDYANGQGMYIGFTIAAGSSHMTASTGVWLSGASFIAATNQTNTITSMSDRFRITGVVVLPGIYAPTAAQSPLIMRPYDQELVTCLRYWERITSSYRQIMTSSGLAGVLVPFKVTKRAGPTTAFVANGGPLVTLLNAIVTVVYNCGVQFSGRQARSYNTVYY